MTMLTLDQQQDRADRLATILRRAERISELLTERTGVEFTFGYIGNVNSYQPGTHAYRDDRLWYFFAAHPGRIGDHRDHIGGYHTADLEELLTEARGVLQMLTILSTRNVLRVSKKEGAIQP